MDEVLESTLNGKQVTKPLGTEEEDMDDELGPIMRVEVERGLNQLKNGKAPSLDNIPMEILKADLKNTVDILISCSQKIWEEAKIPNEWENGHVMKTPKKDISQCKNWKDSQLLPISRKVFTHIILDRIKKAVD